MSISVAVVIPMYNEERGAAACVQSVSEVLANQSWTSSLVVVDDGSTDDTRQILEQLQVGKRHLTVVGHDSNRGYGAALRTGAEAASRLGREWLLFMDSDLTNPPSDIIRFAAHLDGSVDYVKATRYGPGGAVEGVPRRRRVVSVLGNRFTRLASGGPLTDPTNGFRAIRTEVFLALPLRERGFPVILEEFCWAMRMGLRCAEVATTLRDRPMELRPSSFRYHPSVLWAYGRHPLRLVCIRAGRLVLRRRRCPNLKERKR